jgi:hypothetical protein
MYGVPMQHIVVMELKKKGKAIPVTGPEGS